MRVLLLSPIFPPAKGGAAIAFNYLCHILKKNSKVSEIFLLTGWRKNIPVIDKSGKLTVVRALNYENRRNPLLNFTWNTTLIREFIKSVTPGLIIFHSFILPFREYYGELFKQCGECRIYLYKTDLLPVSDFPELTGVIYLSRNLERKLVDEMGIPAAKLSFVPPLFKPPRLPERKSKNSPGPPYPFPYILFVGSVEPMKGVFELIRAFKFLKPEFPRLKLIVIGPGPGGITFFPDVLFYKELNKSTVYRHIKHAEVIVLPSYAEGIPRVAMETLYLKRPLIISKVAEETRGLPPTQILERIEAREIAAKIKGILKGGTFRYDFPWEELAFKRVEGAWNELVHRACRHLPAQPGHIKGEGLLPFTDTVNLKEKFRAAQSYAMAIEKAGDWRAIPRGIKEHIPSLEKIQYIDLLKTLNRKNFSTVITGICRSPFLLAPEKKALLKEVLTQLENKYRLYLQKQETDRCFLPLVPLVSTDMLFLGRYFLRQKQPAEAKDYLLKGLDILPEGTHLQLYHHLLAGAGSLLEPTEHEAVTDAFRCFLDRLDPGQLLDIAEESQLSFLNSFTCMETVFRAFQQSLRVVGSPGHTWKESVEKEFKLYYLWASYREKNGDPRWRDDLETSVRLLARKRGKSAVEIYRMASIYKRLNHRTKAVAGFKRVIGTADNVGLLSGSYFHLGELALFRRRTRQAHEYFICCMEYNPMHQKAAAYLDELKEISK